MKIEAPKNCPACGTILERVNDQLFCRNEFCPAQNSKAIVHFAKTAKIKGLGEASILRLGLESIEDIYYLTEEHLEEVLGKSGKKIYREIENSKLLPLEMLLPAFSIPLIGKTAAKKLQYANINLDTITKDELLKIDGIGEKAAQSFMNWVITQYREKLKHSLPFSFTFSKQEPSTQKKGVVCISGKLKSFKTKALAEKALKEKGYEVKSSVTKDVGILINESGIESTKTRKAKELGLQIVTNLNDFLGGN